MAEKIKLVASDLDGTLLTTDKVFTDVMFKTICTLQQSGIIFIPTTGRTLGAVPLAIRQIPNLKYIITSNGASINDIPGKKEIFSTCVAYETSLQVLKMAENKNIVVELFSKGEAFIEKRFMENLSLHGISGTQKEYVLSTRKPIKNSLDFLEANKHSIENINLIFNDNDLRTSFKTDLTALNFASITSSSPKNLEVTNKLATKGNALSALCQTLGIAPSQVMAFGDSSNDEDMLRFAGIGIAMENGEQHIKDMADHVAPSCDKNGVLVALKKFLVEINHLSL